MKKIIILSTFAFIFCFGFQAASAQEMSGQKVANYSVGKIGGNTYEHFSFWTNEGKRTDIYYNYGKNNKEIKLEYLGAKTIQGRKGFEVKFPNGLILFAIPTGNNVRVINPRGKYNKVFEWEYEGPVNGVGTACTACAEDETAAMIILKDAYL